MPQNSIFLFTTKFISENCLLIHSQIKKKSMNYVKEIAVIIVALVVYDLLVKKMVTKTA